MNKTVGHLSMIYKGFDRDWTEYKNYKKYRLILDVFKKRHFFRREEELTEKEKNIADIRTSVQVLQKFKHSYISAKLHHIDIMINFSNIDHK